MDFVSVKFFYGIDSDILHHWLTLTTIPIKKMLRHSKTTQNLNMGNLNNTI